MTSPLVSEYEWKLQNTVRDFIVFYLCCVTNHYLLNLQRIMFSFLKKNKEKSAAQVLIQNSGTETSFA